MSDFLFQGTNPSEESCVNLVNSLLSQCFACPPLSHINEIDSNLIVSLCESITGHPVLDLLICQDKVDYLVEAHNVQAVIDMLSLDILGISLSHITGEDIVNGNIISIFNLLQVLEFIKNHSSVRVNSQRVRKISKLMKRKQSISTDSGSRSVKSSVIHFSDIHVSNISSSSNSKTISASHSERKILKPVSPRVRIKVRNLVDTNGKFSIKSSEKENSGVSVKSNLDIATEQNKCIEKTDEDVMDHVVLSEKTDFPIESNDNPHLLPCRVQDFPSKIVRKRKICIIPGSNSKSQSDRMDIERLYEENFELKVKTLIERNSPIKSLSFIMKKRYIQSLQKPIKKTSFSPSRKSFLLPHNLRRKSVSHSSGKSSHFKKRYPCSPNKKSSKKSASDLKTIISTEPCPGGLINELLSEFPSIPLSPSILKHIKEKYEQHLFKIHNKVKNVILQMPKTQIQEEKAAEKQCKISKILEKDRREKKFLEEVREQKKKDKELQYRLRDSRIKSIQTKQYVEEFQDEMRKKMNQGNNEEALIFERAFKEVINIQKNEVDRLCQRVKESSEEDARKHLNYLSSLENLYQSQFQMLSELLVNERRDANARYKAEKENLDKMERDFKQMLKKDIRFLQKATVEMAQDHHFRELDAERFIERKRDQCRIP